MKPLHTIEPLKARVRDALLETELGYRAYLRRKWGATRPQGQPKAPWRNAALKTRQEWQHAADQVKALGLPWQLDLPKNWDSLAALDCILQKTDPTARILDAGAELYSVILPWLFLYGYKHVTGINLVFDHPIRRGPIRYEYGDITKTQFPADTFDAITCLSVIEHGVDLRAYFQEMARILKPNGLLITSTDYHMTPIDTKGQVAYGVPIHIFSQEEIFAALDIARELGLEPTGPLDPQHDENPVRWEAFELDYTFLTFTLQKKG